MARPALRDLAVPAVCLLIIFLAYTSQYLFYHLDPGPLTGNESFLFNAILVALWWSYQRAVRIDPGRLPEKFKIVDESNGRDIATMDEQSGSGGAGKEGRWCLKCKAVKPPRSHHCRQCGRCIPKMDHHCPWTSNCVSHTTFPHFLRFVFYVIAALLVLGYHLFKRLHSLYLTRNQPSYLGPSIWALTHLMVLTLTATLVFFALTILLVTAVYSLVINTTMIETWEIERHASLVDRSRYLGGFVYGPGGRRIRIVHQEFPYDIGLWKNIVQGMGTAKFFMWFMPFGGGPANESGWEWETNGFDEDEKPWPPIDPDKLQRVPWQSRKEGDAFIHRVGAMEELDEVQAFRERQAADYKRWDGERNGHMRSGTLRSSEYEDDDFEDQGWESEYEEGMDGEEGWTSSDGSRLRDFGVDEDAEAELELRPVDEFDDDDDVPLGELIRRRKVAQGQV